MVTHLGVESALPAKTREFYARIVLQMQVAEVPFLIGGAYALERYTGIERHTKDLDLFVLREDAQKALDVMAHAGYHTEMTFPHWLAKAYGEEDYIDVIFGSGNGLCPVDREWFAHARTARLFGTEVQLCPPEEMIWSKSFIMERERFDGADVAHLLLACAHDLDWDRLVQRFGQHWSVLLTHLLMFRFIYPDWHSALLEATLNQLLTRCHANRATGCNGVANGSAGKLCQGTLLSREQYLIDIDRWGYRDARVALGTMTPEQVEQWTEPVLRGEH